MKVQVYELVNRVPILRREFDVETKLIGTAKRLVREALVDEWTVRAVSRVEGGGIVAYVQKKPEPPKRKKPVRHTGPVGQGRRLDPRREGRRR